jgi:putative membrane protein
MRLILIWLLNAAALLAIAYLMPSIQVASFGSAMIAALMLGLVNTLLRPLLVLLTLPITLLTLGLFLFVLNGLMFWLAGSILEGFVVGGFWSAVFGAVLYSIFSSILSSLLPIGKRTK